MKICLINNLYGDFARGGAERIVKLCADGFAASGHEVVIITARPFFSHPPETDGSVRIRYLKSSYHYLDRLPRIFRLFFHLGDMFDIAKYFELRSILKNEKPDLVITHNLAGLGLLTPIVIKRLRLKHIHTLHDIQLLHPSGLMLFGKERIVDSIAAKIYQLICKELFSGVLVVVSPSKWLMNEHEKRGFFAKAEKIVLPNPFFADKTASVHNGEKTRKEFKMIYAGLIEEHKGILFLLRALDLLAGKIPAFRLTVAGDGSQFKKAARMAGKNDNVEFLGRVDNAKIMDLMAEADCLVCPSLCYENSPTVIYEAIGMGLPVIASRIGGITELVHEFGGVLFAPGDGRDLADKIRSVTKDRRLGRDGIKSGDARVDIPEVDYYVAKLLSLA